MSDLYRRGDLNAFGMQEVSSPDGSYAYPLAAEYLDHMIEEGALVPVEPVGTVDVYTHDGKTYFDSDKVPDGVYALIPLEADDE